MLVGLDGCEVRLCGPCAFVRPRVPCVSRLPPVSFYRYVPVQSCGGHTCSPSCTTSCVLQEDNPVTSVELISMPHMSSAEVVHHLTFGDIFVQSPDLRWCLLHNCEVESLAVMRQLCSTFVRDVPRVINSKDWQLKHRCVILYKESSRKQCTTFCRIYRHSMDPQEAGWLAFITGSDMARPDLVMRQLAAGMASSRVYSFIWTNFEDSPDSSRLDSSYGKAKKCHPRPHAPPRDIAGGFDAGGGARGGGSGGGVGGSVAEERDERHIEREKARAMPDYWEKRIATTSPDGFAAIPLDHTGRDRRTWAALQRLLQTDPVKLKLSGADRRGTTHDRLELACAWRLENLWEKYMSGVQGVMNDMKRIRQGRVASAGGAPPLTCGVEDALPGDLRVDVNEAFLMHGTNAGVLFNILSQGMNERFASTKAAYGEGSFLAEDAGKNDQYTRVDLQYDGDSELHQRLYAHEWHPGKVFYTSSCAALRSAIKCARRSVGGWQRVQLEYN